MSEEVPISVEDCIRLSRIPIGGGKTYYPNHPDIVANCAADHLEKLTARIRELEEICNNAMKSAEYAHARANGWAEQQSNLGILLDAAGFKGIYFPEQVKAACFALATVRTERDKAVALGKRLAAVLAIMPCSGEMVNANQEDALSDAHDSATI